MKFNRVLSFVFVFFMCTQLIYDQQNCRALVVEALSLAADACEGIALNQVCYGNSDVQAQFLVEDVEFDTPSDMARLNDLLSMSTMPFNSDAQTWGISTMKVQADLPDTIPGQAITFILMGAMQVNNEVDAADATNFRTRIPVTTQFVTNARSEPYDDAFVIDTIPAGTTLDAYMRDATQQWVRVTRDNAWRWIHQSVLTIDGDMNQLPIDNSEMAQAPMQAFYLQPGIGSATCRDAPDSLLIQSPNHLVTEITVNGQEMQVGSTIIFEIDSANNLVLSVLDGAVNFGTVAVPTGYRVEVPIDEEGEISGRWNTLRPMTDAELQAFQIMTAIPTKMLSYPITIPSREEIDAIANGIEQAASTDDDDSDDDDNMSGSVNNPSSMDDDDDSSDDGDSGEEDGDGDGEED